MFDNIILLVDSYKLSHYRQYPPTTKYIYSYFESREGAKWRDTVFFGLQYYMKRYLEGQVVTREKIDEAEELVAAHLGSKKLFNRAGWEYILEKYDGRLPVEIKAVPEGTVVGESNVLMTVTNTDSACFWLPNYLETLLVQVWYPSTVATQSREMKKVWTQYLQKTGTPESVNFKLHDFGFRGVSCPEQAGLGGAAHLINFLGTDTFAAISLLKKYYGVDMAGYSIPACYDDKTEILTNNGFKYFCELTNDDLVAQYDNGAIEFIKPSTIHKYEYNGKMYEFSNSLSSIVVSPNHRMLKYNKKNDNYIVVDAELCNYGKNDKLIISGITGYTGNNLSMLDRLKIAFQADGSFPSRKDKYDGSRTGCFPIRFTLKKQRKIDRLDWILKELGFEYSKNYDKTNRAIYWIKVPDEQFCKTFNWVNLSCSKEYAQEFIEEASMWDGKKPTKNTLYYCSSIKYNCDIIQALAVISGNRATLNEQYDDRMDRKIQYYVNIVKNSHYISGVNIEKKQVNYTGNIYCVTVDTGLIIVRRNGCVCVCGNSEHSTITSWGRNNEELAMKNMLDAYPASEAPIIACVSDSYNIYDACKNIWGNHLKQNIIDRGGTLVVRPDTGDPVSTVIEVIRILMGQFGFTYNSKGYKVLPDCVRVIQGDGIDFDSFSKILEALDKDGISCDNIAMGSGGGLLQKVNRDTQRFAFKCSAIYDDSGCWKDVYKEPIGDKTKNSKRGILQLRKIVGSHGYAYTTKRYRGTEADELELVFQNGNIMKTHNFKEIRERAS